MLARLITRCGCERTIDVSVPPPPNIVLPLKPPLFNYGMVRPWMNTSPADYDPRHSGVETRIFRLSPESVFYGGEPWYDEVTEHDPPGYVVDARTYPKAVAATKEG